MIIFIALLLLAFYKARFSKSNQFNEAYMGRKNTVAINGIFVMLVLFSHYKQYADLGGPLDDPYLAIRAHMDQLVVAPFLFYSGYGMMESIRAKGEKYINKIPRKFLQLLFRFDCAVLLFLLLDIALGIEYPVRHIMLAFTGWTGIGNSNWYIFDILIIYILFWIAFRVTFRLNENIRYIAGACVLLCLTTAFVYVLMRAGKDEWWYNTVLLLPAGVFWSLCRGRVEPFVCRNDISYRLILVTAVAAYITAFRMLRDTGVEGYTIWAFLFMAIVLLVTMKLSICNEILVWIGRHVFSIYILQRIPMILFDKADLISGHKYLGLIAVIAVTLPLAEIFDRSISAALDYVSGKVRQ